MAIYCLGDLHFGATNHGLEFSSRIRKQLDSALDKIVNDESRLKQIVILGDIVHNAISDSEVLYVILDILIKIDSLDIPTKIIKGNHDDKIFKGSKHGLFDVLNLFHFKNIEFISELTFSNANINLENGAENVNLIFIPYNFEIKPGDISFEYDWRKIVFCHLELPPSLNPRAGSESSMIHGKTKMIPEFMLKDSKIVKIINGHYHSPQDIGKIIMPGSLENLRFGEGGNERLFLKIGK